jgi:hypothetical protein
VASTRCPKTAESVALELPLEPASARRARGAVASLRSHLDASSFDALRLMVSELVADSIAIDSRSPKGTISLRAEALDAGARIDFALAGVPLRPRSRKPRLEEPGWGMYLVQTLASRWGARHDGETTSIWFELESAGPAAEAPTL